MFTPIDERWSGMYYVCLSDLGLRREQKVVSRDKACSYVLKVLNSQS